MLRGGQETAGRTHRRGNANRREPVRRCVVTRESQPKTGLVRFVVAPDNTIVPDVAETLPGRGIWVAAERSSIDTARYKGLFSRAVRRKVETPDDLADRVESALARRCIELIGLARRGGGAVAGYERVRSFVAEGRAGLLLIAADAGASARGKLAGSARRVPVVDCLDRWELGSAFGREHMVHAALASGRLAERLCVEAGRLAGFRRQTVE